MDVAIVTYHSAKNYGAILQCYALQRIISQDTKHQVKVLNYTPEVFYDYFPNPRKIGNIKSIKKKVLYTIKWILRPTQMKKECKKYDELSRFIVNELKLTKNYRKEELVNTNNEFDVFVVGSDQVWNLEMTNRDTAYVLDFVRKKKISYAASTKLLALKEKDIELLLNNLKTYSHVSVRERDVQEYFSKCGIEVHCDVDPTMLMTASEWNKLAEKATLKLEDYVLIYYVNAPQNLIRYAFEYAKHYSLKVVSLNFLKGKEDYIDFSDASIEEFLWLIKNAKCVFTTSFHGFVFSSIFNKKMFYEVPENSANNNQRLNELARILGLEEQNLSRFVNFESVIEWETINEKINVMRIESSKRLIQYIEND